jgi:hypothetical protein
MSTAQYKSTLTIFKVKIFISITIILTKDELLQQKVIIYQRKFKQFILNM